MIFFKCFFLLTLRSYGTDLPRGRGRLTLREDLTLSDPVRGQPLLSPGMWLMPEAAAGLFRC